MATKEPLMMLEETQSGFAERNALERVRVLRVFVGGFTLAIVIGAALTASRLMNISSSQNYIDANYPACRKGYVLANYRDAGGDKLLMWSGKSEKNCAFNELCDDLWSFDATLTPPMNRTSKWKLISQTDTRPEPRWKTVVVQDRLSNLYIFAGDPLRPDGSFIHDVWKLTVGGMEWAQLQPVCDEEEETCVSLDRRAHAAVMIGSVIYVHGGKSPSSSLLNDVWALDTDSMLWTQLDPGLRESVKRGLAPIARKGHSLVPVDALWSNASGMREEAIVLFGGRVNMHQYFSDTWAFFPSQSRWERLDGTKAGLSQSPNAPHRRDHHAAAIIGDSMYVYGGWYQLWHAFDDIARFDLVKRTWTQVAPAGPKPQGRFLVSILPIGNRYLYLVGGELGSDHPGQRANLYTNDVWAFDTAEGIWNLLGAQHCPRDHLKIARQARVPDEDDEDDGE